MIIELYGFKLSSPFLQSFFFLNYAKKKKQPPEIIVLSPVSSFSFFPFKNREKEIHLALVALPVEVLSH